MKVERTVVTSQRIKRCSDRRVSYLFDKFDEYLKAGLSPREAWDKALESYAEQFYIQNRSK